MSLVGIAGNQTPRCDVKNTLQRCSGVQLIPSTTKADPHGLKPKRCKQKRMTTECPVGRRFGTKCALFNLKATHTYKCAWKRTNMKNGENRHIRRPPQGLGRIWQPPAMCAPPAQEHRSMGRRDPRAAQPNNTHKNHKGNLRQTRQWRAEEQLPHSHPLQYVSPPCGDTQCWQFPVQKLNNCTYPEVPTGIHSINSIAREKLDWTAGNGKRLMDHQWRLICELSLKMNPRKREGGPFIPYAEAWCICCTNGRHQPRSVTARPPSAIDQPPPVHS